MSIWKTEINLNILEERNKNSFCDYLGIKFIEIGDNYLKAEIPIVQNLKQAIGIMNGGVSCAIAETVGSNAANFSVDITKEFCVGLDINTNHLRAVYDGIIIAIAKPIHLGKSIQVWSIEIFDKNNKMVSINRLTMAVLQRK